MKAEKKQKAKTKSALQSRRGIVLIVVLAVLILVVNIVTASFSWFSPVSTNGAGMQYLNAAYNRSEQCTFSSYEGHIITAAERTAGHYTVDGVEYSTGGKYVNQIDYVKEITTATIGAGQTKYFRTSIVNPDEDYASVVSLYLASIGVDANNGAGISASNLTVACTFPSNTVQIVKGNNIDFPIIRNAYVKKHDANDADGPGLLQVDWFVKNNGSASITIDLSVADPENPNLVQNPNMYLMYN